MPLLKEPGVGEARLALVLCLFALGFHLWGVQVGWASRNLPGVEYRQAQTALSAHFIKEEGNFSPAYPTPVLGKPWSIPMEFPLYQWTVAMVSRTTDLSIIKSGRLVSIICFYLCLPALWLLLAGWRVPVGWRWLVLAMVLTCPFYIFYARAVLIETMALMFALWFWVAFERAVAGRNTGWLILAVMAGMGAGLTKVTTFLLYLIPPAAWAVARLWREGARWRSECGWMAGAVALPFAAAIGWVWYSDAIKARNPLADFLLSGNLREFNLGTWAMRLDPQVWGMQWRVVRDELTWLPVLGILAGLIVLVKRRRREVLLCVGSFVAALMIFPLLYALHAYYFMANTMFLLLAMGLILVGLAETVRWRWLAAGLAIVVATGQAGYYVAYHWPMQRGLSAGGDGLSESLRALTRPDEVIIITGQDWNSMTPFYARRRAMMLRADTVGDVARLDAAFSALKGAKVGALVLERSLGHEVRADLVRRAGAHGLTANPLYVWRDFMVYVPEARWRESFDICDRYSFHETDFAPGVHAPYGPTERRWVELSELRPRHRTYFRGMQPEPVRFYSAFGLALDDADGRPAFGAHPDMRLIFVLPAGRQELATTVLFPLDAYRADLPDEEATDGVEITLVKLTADGEGHVLATQQVDPRINAAQRGAWPMRVEFELEEAGEVELFIGPGPAGLYTRDWVRLGPLTITPR